MLVWAVFVKTFLKTGLKKEKNGVGNENIPRT